MNSEKEHQDLLVLCEKIVNEKDLGYDEFYNLLPDYEFETKFYKEALEEIEEGWVHLPEVPKKKDGTIDLGSSAFTTVHYFETWIFAIHKILKNTNDIEIVVKAYDRVSQYIGFSMCGIEDIIDKYFEGK